MNNEKKLEAYLEEIEKVPLLSGEAEKELAKKAAEENDDGAKNRLAKANLKLVVRIAEVYKDNDQNFSIIDLIEQGNLGLFKAVDMYVKNKQYEKDYKFSTYATWWIRQAIVRKLAIEK